MGEKVDRRVMRTRRMLRDALTELMEEKGFDAISVSDITAKADINRGTFYLHYKDKFDLLEQNANELIAEIKKIKDVSPMPKEKLQDRDLLTKPSIYMVSLFEYVQENAEFMKVLLGPNGDPAFQMKLKEVMRSDMEKNITANLNDVVVSVPLDVLSAYAVSAQLGVIQHWLETGMKQQPEEIALHIRKIFFGSRDALWNIDREHKEENSR
ncbi:MAG: TetR/AcrR family transcriptional regulator [Bacillus sp. (in: firmicutes)]